MKIDEVLLRLGAQAIDVTHMDEEITNMSPSLQALKDQVTATTSVNQSAIALINGMAKSVLDAKDDPAEIAKLVAELQGDASSLSAAITANTPAAAVVDPAPATSPAPTTTPTDPAAKT